jgi:hypothetical protein
VPRIAPAVDALLQLGKADAVAVCRTGKLSRWTGKDGAHHTGLAVTAHKVMTAYAVIRKRRALQADTRAAVETLHRGLLLLSTSEYLQRHRLSYCQLVAQAR